MDKASSGAEEHENICSDDLENKDFGEFSIFVGKENMKFNCAHFVAFEGFRERLHGHNYRLSVRIEGKVGPDGYVLDFGDVKQGARKLCKDLNERFICPMESDVMQIKVKTSGGSEQVELNCEDGAFFSFPKGDCALLPIVHSTAEDLAAYLWEQLLHLIGLDFLHKRHATSMTVTVSEATNQDATFKRGIPKSVDEISVPKRKYSRKRTRGCFENQVK